MAVVTYWNGEKQYEGCVLRTWEHNGYDDSDFYADCVDVENGKIVTVEYDTTRFGGGGYAVVDITQENFRLYLHNAHARLLRERISADRVRAKKVEKGKRVVVVRGKKVPIGVVGELFWAKEVNYDPYGRFHGEEVKIGIRDDDGNVWWTYAKNVEVQEPSSYHKSVRTLEDELRQIKSREFLRLFGGKRK